MFINLILLILIIYNFILNVFTLSNLFMYYIFVNASFVSFCSSHLLFAQFSMLILNLDISKYI